MARGKSKLLPTVMGIGFIGIGENIPSRTNKAYTLWTMIINRCYNETIHKLRPTYIGCSVDKEWHNFQSFAEWYKENYVEDYQLDKDILFKGNKIYSPNTCLFVPKSINCLIINHKTRRGILPIGVKESKTNNNITYWAQLTTNSTHTSFGPYLNINDAFISYKNEKEKHIKSVADKFKDKIPNKLYLALYNYVIEITD